MKTNDDQRRPTTTNDNDDDDDDDDNNNNNNNNNSNNSNNNNNNNKTKTATATATPTATANWQRDKLVLDALMILKAFKGPWAHFFETEQPMPFQMRLPLQKRTPGKISGKCYFTNTIPILIYIELSRHLASGGCRGGGPVWEGRP